MQNPYYWVSWIIACGSMLFALYRELANKKARQKAAEVAMQERIHKLEIDQKVDQAKTTGQLELINQKLAQATTAANQASQALKTILANEQQ